MSLLIISKFEDLVVTFVSSDVNKIMGSGFICCIFFFAVCARMDGLSAAINHVQVKV